MTGRSITSTVEVGVDPATAFRVFTEELDRWWRQGPINFFDSTRAIATRLEPGLGGRLLEVYDAEGGGGLELARVTAWEPPSLVGWASSIDDVTTEVRFEPSAGGTLVRVTATIPEGGADRGGTAWVRVTPTWLAWWLERRDRAGTAPVGFGRLAVAVHYRDPVAAARWLLAVAGLEAASRVPEPHEQGDEVWIELRAGDAAVIVLGLEGGEVATPGAAVPWVFVDDLDAHHRHLLASGGTVVVAPWRHGTYAYAAADPEGVVWTFAQATPAQRATSGGTPAGG